MLFSNNQTTKECGDISEELAKHYLEQAGLYFITGNFHSRQGEIDLIMKDQQTLVFIEVKYRKNSAFGGAISAIPYKKQQKIRQCAKFYLQQHELNEYNTDCRFDVMALQGKQNEHDIEITWLKNAF
jgi:putative endonuclease